MSVYSLVVGKAHALRAHKLCDCSDQVEVAEHWAVEAYKELWRRGRQDRIVRVVEAETRIVQFAVHQGNLGNLGG